MQKYIAVVNPKMDEDEITRLIHKGIAGALFEISHQNYPVALQLIQLVQKLSKKYHKPVSLIQDISGMEDPLDLRFGTRAGIHWIATDKHEHVKLTRGINKLAGIIFKGHNLPKGVRVDSVMADLFADPDAEVIGGNHIKHLMTDHTNQKTIDSLIHLLHHSNSAGIAVSDLGLAKGLSFRRLKAKIIFAPTDRHRANHAAIYRGVHPIFMGNDLISSIRHHDLAKRNDRIMDATDPKHIEVHLIP